MKTKKLTFLALCSCLALIFSYVETMIPPIYPAVPGIKMGLANIMTVFVLFKYGASCACIVSFVRITLAAMLFGNPWSLAYSAAGAVLSLAVMILLKKTNKFSSVGISIAGGVFHNAGQILLAMLVLETKEIGFYMAILAVTGMVSGVLIGLAAAFMLKFLKRV